MKAKKDTVNKSENCKFFVSETTKEMEKSGEKKILWEAIKRLNAREQKIMELRFGLTGEEESTQKEVADRMGI